MARLVVGLGNPGREYECTRHNAGFLVVDLLAEDLRVSHWKDEAGAKSAVARIGEQTLVLAKPQTFMNASGDSVERLVEAYEIPIAELIVVHDDIDLAFGRIRVKRGGGHGGHNGLRSLHDRLDSDEYARVRVGVGRPPGRMDPADYVLEPLRGAEWEALEACVPTAAQAVFSILEHDLDFAMREFNRDD